jgi:hypothetical protein
MVLELLEPCKQDHAVRMAHKQVDPVLNRI